MNEIAKFGDKKKKEFLFKKENSHCIRFEIASLENSYFKDLKFAEIYCSCSFLFSRNFISHKTKSWVVAILNWKKQHCMINKWQLNSGLVGYNIKLPESNKNHNSPFFDIACTYSIVFLIKLLEKTLFSYNLMK